MKLSAALTIFFTVCVSSAANASEQLIQLVPGTETLIRAGSPADTRIVCQSGAGSNPSSQNSFCVCDWVKNNQYGWGEYALNLLVIGKGRRPDRKIMLEYFSNTNTCKQDCETVRGRDSRCK